MQEKTIRHLCEADTDDLPITELRTLFELVRNAIIFSKYLGGINLQRALFLSRAARAIP